MGIEVVIVEGASDTGKSTLVRGFSGIGRRKTSVHPHETNVVKLAWNFGNAVRIHETLIWESSLNEGDNHSQYQCGDFAKQGIALVAPRDLSVFLDAYEALGKNSVEIGRVRKAVLVISTTENSRNFTASDYASQISAKGKIRDGNGKVTAHRVTDLVSLRASRSKPNILERHLNAASVEKTIAYVAPSGAILKSKLYPRNLVAQRVRGGIGLL